MPCRPIGKPGKLIEGFVCYGNEPVKINDGGHVYRFEWTASSGWMPVNEDGSQRLTRVPNGAWDALVRRYPHWSDAKEVARKIGKDED